MSAWGVNGSARSCDALLKRVEANDPTLKELVILPLKIFESKDLRRLANALRSNTHLTTLNASGHHIDDVESLEELGRSLASQSLSPMTELAIGDSQMGDAGVKALCRGLKSRNNLKLETIDLSWKGISSEGFATLLCVLGTLPSLKFLNLAQNDDVGPFFDFSSCPLPLFPNLTMLDLSKCGLNAETCCSLVKAIGAVESGSRRNTPLSLKFDSNDLRDHDYFYEMLIYLCEHPILAELYISGCELGDEGLRQMINCGRHCITTKAVSSLQVLDLADNNLSSAVFCDFFTEVLRTESKYSLLSHLRKLNLSGNTLDEKSCQQLAASITEGRLQYLHELDVTRTFCGVNGAMALVQCNLNDPSQCSLKVLTLFGNKLGSDGFVQLSKALEGGHPMLESLDLGGNDATEAGVVALLQALTSTNTTANVLRLLVVGGNQGGDTVEALVKEIKRKHPELDIARDNPGKNRNNVPTGTSWMS
ncbi:leucine rich repeat LRR-containing protein [Nitzschia inconspicua]|uniref:Leucine rich repeat LRR-containing protein n=1 Tax=Nitzschia inconspicua TaxID=303405 RepID=A0A9K3KJV8_9STRA|nr:leucine rich repeat LRR-containing protein [Nitzschia inconspicua]